jgi:O-succinylbenzoic acid--CoA ligase
MRDWLSSTARSIPDEVPALVIGERTWTYFDLMALVNDLCGRLDALRVKKGDKVAALLPNGVDYVCLIHALTRIGGVLVPLNLRLTADEIRWQIEQAGCKFLICADELPAIPVQPITLDELAKIAPTDFSPVNIELDAVQSIVFTSGTSGRPKGAQITFGNLYHSALASAERLGASLEDRWLCPLPFYHVGGLSIVFRSAIYAGAVVLPEATSTEAIIKGLHDSRATIVSLVPTQLYRMLEAGFEPPPSLRLVLLGGAAATSELIARCIEKNLPIALTYGLTECASQVATATPEQVRAKPGTVGKPLDGTTVRVVDADGYDLPSGEYGEIVVGGATVMKGYLSQPPTNGEFHTGEIGYLDADGDLWIVQRRSDLIVSGGENVYPSEVEAALRQHPAVEDACVVGLPDAEWGQRVAAMVALRKDQTLSETDLIAFSRERLAGYKQPRKIVFVDDLPQTASGKIQRAKVKEKLLAFSD